MSVFLSAALSATSLVFFFLMIRRPPRSTLDRSSAASDVYKRQDHVLPAQRVEARAVVLVGDEVARAVEINIFVAVALSLIHISEPTRPY